MTLLLTSVVVMAGWTGAAVLAALLVGAAIRLGERTPDDSLTRRFMDLGQRPERPELN